MQADPGLGRSYLPEPAVHDLAGDAHHESAPFFVERLKKMLAATLNEWPFIRRSRRCWSGEAGRRCRRTTTCRRAVARRLYRDTRGALTPDPPAVRVRCSC